jgi:hypothetical protein
VTKNGRAVPATTLNLDSVQSGINLDQHDEELKLLGHMGLRQPK